MAPASELAVERPRSFWQWVEMMTPSAPGVFALILEMRDCRREGGGDGGRGRRESYAGLRGERSRRPTRIPASGAARARTRPGAGAPQSCRPQHRVARQPTRDQRRRAHTPTTHPHHHPTTHTHTHTHSSAHLELVRQRPAGGVGDVEGGGPRLDHLRQNLIQEGRLGAACRGKSLGFRVGWEAREEYRAAGGVLKRSRAPLQLAAPAASKARFRTCTRCAARPVRSERALGAHRHVHGRRPCGVRRRMAGRATGGQEPI